MTLYQLFILCLLLFKDVLALKNVVLTITPSTVERNQAAVLQCLYDLEDATLYYVKWYRGTYEFYRFTPSEHPYSKVFPLTGVNVDVDHSNSTQVKLLDIDFQLSGQFSCEVTTDEEPAKTGTDTQSMLVIQLPEHPPRISVGRNSLDYGDTLRANCSSPAARPPASLKFIINNMTVAYTEPLSLRKSQELLWSDLTLDLVLSQVHFNQDRLFLKCVSRVTDIYHEESSLELESARNPTPEKVSFVSSDCSFFRQSVLQVFAIIFLIFMIK